MDFYEAWEFLNNHKYFMNNHIDRISCFKENLYIEVVKVNPENNRIEDDESLNTKTQVWLECGTWGTDECFSFYTHDPILDCGADTFEEAIIKLAELVKIHYGDGHYSKKEDDEYYNEVAKGGIL